MQGKAKTTVLVFVTLGILLGCSQRESFERAILRSKQGSIGYLPKVKTGLPYFLQEGMTPTWDLSGKVVSLPDFELRDHQEKKVDRSRFLGKPTFVTFLFTSCAGICPLLVKKMRSIEAAVGSEKPYNILAITVDPEVDTPKRLSKFAQEHGVAKNSHWIFATGTKQELLSLAHKTFETEVKRLPADNLRKFAHTEHFYVLDRQTRLRAILNGTRIDLPKSAAKTYSQLN